VFGGVLLLVVFVTIELRVDNPMIQRHCSGSPAA
jgi:hypothetical protein